MPGVMICPSAKGQGPLDMVMQNAVFEARLARIREGQSSGRATVFVGQDLTFTYVPRNRRRNAGAGEVLRNAGHALSFPLCLAIGFASHGLERYADWVFRGIPQAPENIDLEMLKMAVTGACFAIVISHLAGLRDRILLVPTLLGVVLGMLFFHNLVHLYPAQFEAVFAPIWVARITSLTEAHSLLFRGISFPF